jgi:multiple sugar transport system ATP-binding protein
MASVALSGVRKSFGALEVLHGVDLDIAEGEFVVLVGPSGSGKTTLLRIIAGLERLSAGAVRVDGRGVEHLAPKDRDIAMVFQHYALYPHMTVRENLGFSLRMRNEPKTRVHARVDEVAAILGLTPLLERRPAQLSGGQQQRVAIGRAIVRKPRVFLFDEPLSNLDGALRAQMRTELKSLQRRLGITSLYVTHDQMEAMAMADRIAVLRQGRIEQVGTPLELYQRPANLFVAGFIGVPPMNLVPATVLNGAQAGDVVYGFRPEACALGTQDGMPATITAVEHLGAAIHVYADLAGRTVCAVSTEPRWSPGMRVRLRPDPERLLVFDAESGRALAGETLKEAELSSPRRRGPR